MDVLRSAIPLARLLLKVAESRRDVTVRVRAGGRTAELSIAGGYALALSGVDGELLGDALMRHGALDQQRHGAALSCTPPVGPVGRWLVDVGAAPSEAVSAALREQLEERIARMLGWVGTQVTLAPPLGQRVEVRANLVLAVWKGLVRLAAGVPASVLYALRGNRAVSLSRFGERLLASLEAAGVDLDQGVLLAAHPPESLCCARAVFRVLGALSEHTSHGESYSLLLRKRGEIQRRVGAVALLDLREPVRLDQVRSAFRRLAYQLHPDRFQCEHPELMALSSEVMSVLSQAEAELRATRRAG